MDYIQFRKDGKHWLEHRYVWTQANGEIPKGMQIHHINGDTKDNRLTNLRLVTASENNEMKQSSKGYTLAKNNKYQAQRKFNGKNYFLGFFDTPCCAYMAHRTFYIGT